MIFATSINPEHKFWNHLICVTLDDLEIGLRKWDFSGVKEFFPRIRIWKMGVKINIRIITKNHAADSKIDFRADGTHDSYPTAGELKNVILKLILTTLD